jgi:hypothetical protein
MLTVWAGNVSFARTLSAKRGPSPKYLFHFVQKKFSERA